MPNKYRLDLDAAWRQVLREANRQEIVDVLRYEDYKLTWKSTKADLETELDSDSYVPRRALVVEVPKDGFVVRPFAQLDPRDRVVYEAIVALIRGPIDEALADAVKSARLTQWGVAEKDQRKAWINFQAEARDLHVTQNLGFMLSTDVASYYEYVEVKILARELKELPGVDAATIDLLSRFLNELIRSSEVWGLPQGPEASSALGNFYLLPLDRDLLLHSVRFVRFGDDVKMLSNDKAMLRHALASAIRVLRARHLNVSVHKTKLLEGDEILAELEDTRKDAIQYGIDIGSSTVADDLHRLFDDAVAGDPIGARDVRFAVYRLGKQHDDYAVPWVLQHLADVPYLAALLVNYLSLHIPTHSGIEVRTRRYLGDAQENVYPWVEFNLIRMLARASQVSDATVATIWAILRDANKAPLVRQHAARCLGRHARAGDRSLLEQALVGIQERDLRRALLVAITEAAGAPDKPFLNTQAAAHPDLVATCSFLKSGVRISDP